MNRGAWQPWGCKESDTSEQLTLSLHFLFDFKESCDYVEATSIIQHYLPHHNICNFCHICKVPLPMQANIFTGSRDQGVDNFKLLICLPPVYSFISFPRWSVSWGAKCVSYLLLQSPQSQYKCTAYNKEFRQLC